IFTLLIGLPILISEYIIGRGAGYEAISFYKNLAPDSICEWVGGIGDIDCFLLLIFYSLVDGWAIICTLKSLIGQVIHTGADYEGLFVSVITSPTVTLGGLLLFKLCNVVVNSFGIKNGIERANKYMMPLLFIFFLIIVVRALTLEGAMEG